MTIAAQQIKQQIKSLQSELKALVPAGDLSVRELAKRAGISPATASRFKNGKAVDVPTARKLFAAGLIKECPCCGHTSQA